MSRLLAGLVAAGFLLIGLFIIFGAVGAAESDLPTENKTVVNESIVQDIGNWTPVEAQTNGSALSFNDTVTVFNSSDVELVEGDSFEWSPSNGSIQFLNHQNTTDGATASITYTFEWHRDDARTIGAVITPTVRPLWVFAYVAIFIFIVGLLGWIITQTGSSPKRALGGR